MRVERSVLFQPGGSVTILRFVGEFDAFNLPTYSQKIDALVEGGESSLVFNLHLLTFINSSALGYLLKVKKRAQELGGDLVLVQPSKFIRRTLLTLGLQEVFSIHETDEDGVLSFLKTGGARKAKPEEDAGETDGKIIGANAIMFSVVDEEGKNLYGDKPQVGRITNLGENAIEFRWNVPAPGPKNMVPISTENFDAAFLPGTRLRVKFRQPFAMKACYFELGGLLTKVARGASAEAPDEAAFHMEFQDVGEVDRAALAGSGRDPARLPPAAGGEEWRWGAPEPGGVLFGPAGRRGGPPPRTAPLRGRITGRPRGTLRFRWEIPASGETPAWLRVGARLRLLLRPGLLPAVGVREAASLVTGVRRVGLPGGGAELAVVVALLEEKGSPVQPRRPPPTLPGRRAGP